MAHTARESRKEIPKMSGSLLAVFDFDGVLFDDKRFKRDYESLFLRAGVSQEKYEATYVQIKKQGHYDARIHIKLAVHGLKAASVIEKNLFARVIEFTKRSHDYIYADVPDFLRFLGDKEIRAILLSTGDTGFQSQKISKSGIGDLFDEVIIIPDASKVSALKALIRREQPSSVMFIDDKKEVVEEIKASLPSIYVVQMRRRETQLPARNLVSIKNFSGLTDFVEEWKGLQQ